MKELGPALEDTGISFSQKSREFSPQVTSRTWSTRLHARTSVRLRIPILPGRNFAHWTKSSNSLASTAICFFFWRQKGYGPASNGVIGTIFFFSFSWFFLFGFLFSLVHVSCREFDRPDEVFLFLDIL